MTQSNQNTAAEKITIEYSHDTREGWACAEFYLGEELLASNDGSDTTYHTDDEGKLELLEEYFEKNGKADPDWDAYEKQLIKDQAEALRREHADEIVLICNGYETQSSKGFGNTYHIETACEGDESKFGWQKAKPISEIGTEFDAELVAWAREEQIDTIINWF
jgi:hypothetical protein